MKGIKEILLRTGFLICLAMTMLIISLPTEGTAVAGSVYGSVYEMPVPPAAGNCTRCHDPANHTMINCSKCHDEGKKTPQATLNGGHGGFFVSDTSKPFSTAPVENCLICHKYRTDGGYYYDTCSNCHPEIFGYTSPLTPNPNPRFPLDHTHDTTRLNVYKSQIENFTYTCESCHLQASNYGRIWWQAIPQHNLSTFGSVYSHQSSLSAGCENCHYTTLTTEHYQRTDPATGQPPDCFTCHSSVSPAVKLAIKTKDAACTACHNKVHNLNATPNIPADIPLYSGFRWSQPVPLATWAGESWVPAEFLPDGHLLISNRRSDVIGDQVWNFYNTQLPAKGWSTVDPAPAPGATGFRVKFTKGTASMLIWFYGGSDHANDPVLQQGARIEIIY